MGARLGLTLWEEHRLRVFENRVLRRTLFRPKREEEGSRRKLNNDKIHSLYSSPNIGRDIWHAWGRGDVFTGFWLGGLKGRDHREDLGVGGRIALRWTLGR